jgi:hypothetical protein
LGGFGNSDLVELFVQETEFAKSKPVIEEFRMSIYIFAIQIPL